MSNPCGAGLSQFTVDPNADVYPCADLCGQKHFRLGNIGEDFFPMIPSCEGWREIRSYKLQNLTGCKKCTLIKTCPAGCSVRCYYSNDSVHSTDPLCGFYKLILPYLDDTGLAKKIYNENISSVEKLILELCSEINYPRVTFALNPVLHQTSIYCSNSCYIDKLIDYPSCTEYMDKLLEYIFRNIDLLR